MSRRRMAALWAGSFLSLLLVGSWPRPAARAAFSRAYAATANLVLDALSFGADGRARVEPELAAIAGAAVEQDASLVLTVAGVEGQLSFGLNLRRDAFLPTLLVVAALVGAPLPARRKLLGLAIAAGAVLALSLACVWLTAAWLFSTHLPAVYQAGAAWRGLLDLTAGALLLPPSNRFVLPLVVVALLVFRLRLRAPSAPTAQIPPPPAAPAASG